MNYSNLDCELTSLSIHQSNRFYNTIWYWPCSRCQWRFV